MAESNAASSTSSAGPRVKSARTNPTTGTVRSRTPPSEHHGDGRPPTKRARKAINCEPCRNSKLKCDRNRPCSSCVLRGTSSVCYQDARAHDTNDSAPRSDDHPLHRIDPVQEIARLRHSISLLEAHLVSVQRTPQPQRRSEIVPKTESLNAEIPDKTAAPGMLASQGQGGLYAGPTSAATHLIIGDPSEDSSGDSRQQSVDGGDQFGTHDYDRDLLALLPALDVIDGLICYYFDYCSWIYRHVNPVAFRHCWEKFKNGSVPDRLVLATACTIMGVAVHYLPPRHHLLDGFLETCEEIAFKFIDVSRTALRRHQAETRTYSIELIELLLCRCHYLTLCKTDSEEIWSIKGELLSIGTAMGLHRDPGKFKMHRDVAERRRWAWWHIILLERWQAFMFGRPLSIASHHFDTQLPSYCDPALDPTGRYYLPNIALFRLAYILGDIMDDAVSVRTVPYESVQANDRTLTQWMDSLPVELDLDDYRVARSLASSDLHVRRLGVQSVIIRTSYHHIRFTLHRPYASAASAPSSTTTTPTKTSSVDASKMAQSLEIAVSAADKLITMVGQSRPDPSTAVPGHMNWGAFHCFSAAMFFSFQLIANPDQPGASLFRANIAKAMATLEQSRGTALVDKCFDILQALAPLYSVEFPLENAEARAKRRAAVLGTVRKLAFPYHDSHHPRTLADSPSVRGHASTPESNSVSPPLGMMANPPPVGQQHHSMRYDSMGQLHNLPPMSSLSAPPPPPAVAYNQQPHGHTHMSSSISESPHSQQQQQQQQHLSPTSSMHGTSSSHHHQPYQVIQQQQQQPQQQPQPPMYTDHPRYVPYSNPIDDVAMWGASVGFGQGEWAQFLHVMQRQDTAAATGRHGV